MGSKVRGTARIVLIGLALAAGRGALGAATAVPAVNAATPDPCQPDAWGPPGARMFGKLDPQGKGRIGLEAFVAHRFHRFESLDADGDGQVRWAEFAARHPGADPARLAASFRRFDVDHDGIISRDEWRAGETRRFQAIDADGDGAISRDEFLNARRRVCAARELASAGAAPARSAGATRPIRPLACPRTRSAACEETAVP